MFRQTAARALRRPTAFHLGHNTVGVAWRRWTRPEWGRYDSDVMAVAGAHCFLKGTQILTAQASADEDLQIGEMVLTVRRGQAISDWAHAL